jgi:biopolymer transport protein ExbD
MAGAASEDDAISLNVTPLIDIIFCLCIFFICSFHFKQLQGKLDSWLPKDKGNQGGGPTTATMDEIRIFIKRTGNNDGPTEIAYKNQKMGVLSGDTKGYTDADNAIFDNLEKTIKEQYADYVGNGKTDASVIIDAMPEVPWKDVLTVLDRCKEQEKFKPSIEKIEFAQPLPTGVKIPGQ